MPRVALVRTSDLFNPDITSRSVADAAYMGDTPSYPQDASEPDDVIDPDDYANIAALIADPRIDDEEGTSNMSIDSGTSSPDTSTTIKYNFPDGSGGTSIKFQYDFSKQEVWVKFRFKHSTTWDLDNGEPGDQAYKLFFINVTGVSGRFGMGYSNNSQVDFSGPGALDGGMLAPFSPYTLFDNEWHTARLHVRLDGGGSNDFMEWWIDDEYMGSDTGDSTATALAGITVGANLNQGPDGTFQLWWGLIEIWWDGNDPGW